MSDYKTIQRGRHSNESPYFMVIRSTPQDKNLSYEALGMLTYLLSKPDDWVAQVNDLRREGCGRDKVYRILGELVDAGYATPSRRYREENGQWGYTPYEFYESPISQHGESEPENPPLPENPEAADPLPENTDIKHNTEEQITDNNKTTHSPAAMRGMGLVPPNGDVVVQGEDEPIDPPTPQQAYILNIVKSRTLTDAMNQSLEVKIHYIDRDGKPQSNTINNLLLDSSTYRDWIEKVIVPQAKTRFQPPKKISRSWFIKAISNLSAFEAWAKQQHIPSQANWEPMEE